MNQNDPQTTRDDTVTGQEQPSGSAETAPPQDTEGSGASATGDTVAAGPATDRPATAETDEA